MRPVFVTLVAATLSMSLPQSVSAHVRVVESAPAAGATAQNVRIIKLSFSDTLDPARTSTEVVMTEMPGVKNHGLMYIRNYQPSWSADKKTLTLTLRKPLQAGSYEIRWQSSSKSDGHRMNGTVKFDVR